MEKVRLPLARLVAGIPYGSDTNFKGEPNIDKKTGQPYSEWKFRLAIPKQPGVDWKQTPWGQKFVEVAKTESPKHYNLKQYAWKVIDGDSSDTDFGGLVINQREGFAGHWIVTASGRRPPQYAEFQNGAAVFVNSEDVNTFKHNLEQLYKGKIAEIPEEILNRTIVSGDYVYVTVALGSQHTGETPSLFVFPNSVTLNCKGTPIKSVDREDLSELRQQAPVVGVALASSAPVTLNKQFVDGPGSVAPPPSVTPPPPPSNPYRMTEKATATREVYLASGWSDDQLLEHELMVKVG